MTTITRKAAVTVATVAAGLAGVASMLTFAPMAYADSCSFTRDLTVGASGADVTCLQNALIAGGYSIPAGATGFFGSQTQAAVKAWQTAKGISPAAGYFGPISRAAFGGSAMTGGLPAGCTSTSGYSSTTGQSCAMSTTLPAGCTSNVGFSPTTGQSCSATVTLPAGCTSTSGFSTTTGQSCSSGSTSGGPLTGSGRLTNVSSLGNVYSDLHEGDSATAVVGVSVDAKDGDVSIQRVDATFDMNGVSGGSTNLNKYVSDVSLWLGDTKLASMDPSAGDKSSGVWTYRFSGLNGVVKSGTTGNIYVKVTPVESIGSDEDGDTVTAKLLTDSVRAVGADGISDTYIGSDITNDFTVSSATTGTLTVTAGSDNPKASQVAVGSSTTTGVKLLSFNMKAKNADVTITDLKASFGTNDSLSDVVNTVYLMKGSTVIKSKTLSSGTYGTVTFADVNQTISKDSTVNYSIVADLKGDAAYADGTTLVASTTVSGWDVEDANGSAVTPSAAAVGNTQTLTATGISVTLGAPTATSDGSYDGTVHDVGTYTIPFTVTAGDDDVFISGVTGLSGATTKIVYATTSTSGVAKTGVGAANFTADSTVTGDLAGSYYKVLAGTSRKFTLTVSYTATATGYTGLQLSSIAYGATSALGKSYSSNLDTFKTNDIQLR